MIHENYSITTQFSHYKALQTDGLPPRPSLSAGVRFISYMNKVVKLLSVGDLRTTGKSEEIINQVASNPKLFGAVVNAILVENPGVRMRASDVVEKITRDNPEWLKPYKNKILTKIACIDSERSSLAYSTDIAET